MSSRKWDLYARPSESEVVDACARWSALKQDDFVRTMLSPSSRQATSRCWPARGALTGPVEVYVLA
jgi:hypothetical protein